MELVKSPTLAVYNRIHDAKIKYKDSFDLWLEEILIFAKTDKITPKDIIGSFDGWRSMMESTDIFNKRKDNSSEVFDYSLKKYLYQWQKDCKSPAQLTNMIQIPKDLIVEFFNINFFDIDKGENVLLTLIEGIYAASIKLKFDVSEILIRFFKVFFSNYDYEELMRLGPVKTRFQDLVYNMTGEKLRSNLDGTLNIPRAFYAKLKKEDSLLVRSFVDRREQPKTKDYADAMKILKDYESPFIKDDSNVLVPNVTKDYMIVKGANKDYNYLVNKTTGVVLKYFQTNTKIPVMISESMAILR